MIERMPCALASLIQASTSDFGTWLPRFLSTPGLRPRASFPLIDHWNIRSPSLLIVIFWGFYVGILGYNNVSVFNGLGEVGVKLGLDGVSNRSLAVVSLPLHAFRFVGWGFV